MVGGLMAAEFVLEIDVDDDGNFADPGEDLTGDVRSVTTRRGRDYASLVVGRSTAGKLKAVLNNTSGKYSPFNAASPFFGLLRPGLRVRLRSTSPVAETLFTGFLDSAPQPEVTVRSLPIATISASGALIKLASETNTISPEALEGVSTGDVIDAILDAIEWPSGDRNVDSGVVDVNRWYVEEISALEAMRQIEDTEIGFIYEALDWDITFESRYNRDTNRLVSQATFTDDGAGLGYAGISEGDPLREIFNRFTAEIPTYSEAGEAILWTLNVDEEPYLGPGESITFIAQISGGEYVSEWSTPIVGTDVTQTGVANGDIDVDVVKRAKTMEITVTNTHATASASITLLQAKGTLVSQGDSYRVAVLDQPSIDAFGLKSYPLPSPWFPNAPIAEAAGGLLLYRKKDPHPLLTIEVIGRDDTHLTEMFELAISERITVEADNDAFLGVNQDFYIEAISHIIDRGRLPRAVFELSPAPPLSEPQWFTLDDSELDGDDVLAF